MGIGFVLIAYLLILAILAIPISIGIFLSNFVRRGKGKTTISLNRLVIISMYPFLGILYLFIAFILNATFCEYVRGVDPGLGDGWEVPLKNDYKFCMIDDTKDGYLMRYGCTGSPSLFDITRINIFGDSIYGIAKEPFLLNVLNGEERSIKKDSIWLSTIEPKLLSANDFYRKQRGWFGDLFSLVVFSIPPIFLLIWKRKKKHNFQNS